MPSISRAHKSAEGLSTSAHSIDASKIVPRTASVRISSNHRPLSSFIKRLTVQPGHHQVVNTDTKHPKQQITTPQRKDHVRPARLRKSPPVVQELIQVARKCPHERQLHQAQAYGVDQGIATGQSADSFGDKARRLSGSHDNTTESMKEKAEKACTDMEESRSEAIPTNATPNRISTTQGDEPSAEEKQKRMEWDLIRAALRTHSSDADDNDDEKPRHQSPSYGNPPGRPWRHSHNNFFPSSMSRSHQDVVVESVLREQRKSRELTTIAQPERADPIQRIFDASP
ncbi:hypothetical protein MMC24_002963 [Lignoscripta atroalba]|nr:hypothetical protein [Lignoscripta atroalba]